MAQIFEGQVAKWPTAADCKSALLRVRWFESILAHNVRLRFSDGGDQIQKKLFKITPAIGKATAGKSGSSSVGRATAFQAVGRGFEPRLPLSAA